MFISHFDSSDNIINLFTLETCSHSWMTCQTQFLKRTNQGLFFLSSVRIGQVGLEKMSKVLKFTDGQQTSSDGNST
jgi:hypothetical protein